MNVVPFNAEPYNDKALSLLDRVVQEIEESHEAVDVIVVFRSVNPETDLMKLHLVSSMTMVDQVTGVLELAKHKALAEWAYLD